MTSPDAQGKTSVSGGSSRFPRFGFGSQLLQKTVGLVLRPRPGKQVFCFFKQVLYFRLCCMNFSFYMQNMNNGSLLYLFKMI